MPRFRKKPIEFEAELWWPGRALPGVHYEREYTVEDADGERTVREGPYVITAQGQHVKIAPGEWIVAETDGSGFYPIKPDIFAVTCDRLT